MNLQTLTRVITCCLLINLTFIVFGHLIKNLLSLWIKLFEPIFEFVFNTQSNAEESRVLFDFKTIIKKTKIQISELTIKMDANP